MNKKKFLAMLLACVMMLALATGCGGKDAAAPADSAPADSGASSDASSDADSDTASDSGPYKIALIQQHQTNAFQIAVTEAAEAKAAELGAELKILSADQDAATQISQIEQCVTEGYQAILFEPVDPDGLRDAAKNAADAGVVVINIISACTDWEGAGISAVSYGNNVKAGETEMQQVADLLGGKGNIAILTGPSADAGGLQRMEGYENILANYVVIEENTDDTDVVGMGSKITVKDVATGEEESYQVVGSQEADPMNGRISEESPFGKALLGKAIGDVAVVEAPAGNIEYQVVAIQR